MQTSTPPPPPPPPPVSYAPPGPRPRGSGLAIATAAVAFVAALLGIVSLFPRWDADSTLHDTFYNLVANLLFAVVLIVGGVFLLVSRRQWVKTAAALLLAGNVVGYLPGILDDVTIAAKDGGVEVGFWIGQVSNIAAVAAVAMALVFAFRAGEWSWRPSGRVESPVLVGAIGLFGTLLALSWTMSTTKVFDSSNILVNEQFGRLASSLSETSGFMAGAAFVVLALLVVVCTRPAALSGFLLLGLTVAGVADILGVDGWGFSAAQGGIVGPGPGTALLYLVTVGLVFVAVVLVTSRVEDTEVDTGATAPEPTATPQNPSAPYAQAAPSPGLGQQSTSTETAPPPAPPPTPPPVTPETKAVLAQLDDLYASGLLTVEEHAAKRAQVLGGSGSER